MGSLTLMGAGPGSPGGGVAFSPADIAGLQLWLDAEQGLFTTSAGSTPATADGDPVGRWEDQSGVSRHVTQLTAASRPTLKLAIQNGKPVLRFDGVDDFFSFTSWALSDFTAFFVVEQTGDDALLGSDPQLRIGQAANKLSAFDGANNPMSDVLGVAQGTWSVVGYRRSGTTLTFFQNLNTYGSGTLTAPNTFSTLAGLTTIIPLTGDLAEVLIYTAALTEPQRLQVVAYLNDRWTLF